MNAQQTDNFAMRVERLFDGTAFLDDQLIEIANGKIISVQSAADSVLTQTSGTLAPGFIDIQINGGGGVQLNNSPNLAGVERIARAHAQKGVTSFLPTLISDTPETITKLLAVMAECLAVPSVIGLHIEGPFFSKNRRGTHREALIRTPNKDDDRWIASFCELPGIKMLTLAPEVAGPAFIQKLCERGVKVMIGHTQADDDQCARALAAGAVGFTHLFNAMPALMNREPGPVGAALDAENAWCSLIVDGHHVSASNIRLTARTKPANSVLISDAMATVASAEKSFSLYGEIISERDGKLINSEGRLAGAAIGMIDAVRMANTWAGLPLEQCFQMASTYPASLLNLGETKGRISAGYDADLVLLDKGMNVSQTWTCGQTTFLAQP